MAACRFAPGVRVGLAALAGLVYCAGPARAVNITLTPFASGLTFPVDITNAGDSRLFVVEKGGHIKVVQGNGTVLGTDFLDIHTLVSGGSEQGLLGLAFHPNYLSNGFFYVNYTDTSGDTQIVRYQVMGSPATSNVANSGSAFPILSIAQPFPNHNGGDLIFGPDGYLYIGMGDGGSACDPGDRAQDPNELLGKMLRIDVDSGSPYAIPASNPFATSGTTKHEIWALGTRNPFRFSFDRATGDLYIADVGQNALEEIDYQPASSTGGENYGWDCYEGNSLASTASGCSTTATCTPASMFTFPVHEYDHSGGRCSVTGGFVYRGAQPALVGHYFFADYCSSDFYSLTTPDHVTWTLNTFGQPVAGLNPTTFGEDSAGEVYVGGQSDNTIYRIDAAGSPPPCGAEPATGCTGISKAKLMIKNPGDPAKNKLIWKWQNGPALGQSDFGDPVAGGTAYSLCVYAGTSSALTAAIPGGTAWKTVSTTGYEFSDPTAPGDGISKVLLKGGVIGKSKILVKGKGGNLDLSALPLNVATSATVQLIRNDDAECFESVFPQSSIDKDEATQFKAKIP